MLLEGPFEIKAFSQEVFCFCQRDAFGDEIVGLFIEEVIKFFKKICCKAQTSQNVEYFFNFAMLKVEILASSSFLLDILNHIFFKLYYIRFEHIQAILLIALSVYCKMYLNKVNTFAFMLYFLSWMSIFSLNLEIQCQFWIKSIFTLSKMLIYLSWIWNKLMIAYKQLVISIYK